MAGGKDEGAPGAKRKRQAGTEEGEEEEEALELGPKRSKQDADTSKSGVFSAPL